MDELLRLIENLMTYDDTTFSAAGAQLEKALNETFQGPDAKVVRETQIKEFKQVGLTKTQVEAQMEEMKGHFFDLFVNLKQQTTNPDKQQFIDKLYSNVEILAESILDEYDVESPSVSVELCREGAQLPTYAHAGDQGADVYAVEDVVIEPNTFGNMVPTGLKMEIPQGWAIAVRARSGLSRKTTLRVSTSVGTVDTNYRGEINVIFDNIGFEPITIHKGDRIAQLILEKNYQASFTQGEKVSENTDRGAGGFGSAGS